MRSICMVIALCLPACGLAQGIPCSGGVGQSSNGRTGSSEIHGSGCVPGRTVGIGSLQSNLRTDPPSAAVQWRIDYSFHGRSNPGVSYFNRIFTDSVNHLYFGYEMILEEQQPGTYLATFGRLNVTPMEAAASTGSKVKDWSIQALPAMPEPKVVHDGDVIAVELTTDAVTGAKLIDDIEIQPYNSNRLLPPNLGVLPNVTNYLGMNRPVHAVPTVAGTARGFTAADAELQLTEPRVTFNGTAQSTTGRAPAVHGALVWFYLPDHGRYILSLAPRPDLDFQQAGEVRGGAINFILGEDSIKVECISPVATGNAPYHLYVLHDPEWEPTARAQKGQFATGSVDPGELAALKRK